MTINVTITMPDKADYFCRIERTVNSNPDGGTIESIRYLKAGTTEHIAVWDGVALRISEEKKIWPDDIKHGDVDEEGNTIYKKTEGK